MKKIIYIIFSLVFLLTTAASAQSFFSVQYSMGFGSGDTKDYVNNASFRGAALEFRQMVNPNIGVGAEVGWNVFYERRPYDSYTSGTQTLTGVQYRYINMLPIIVAVDYYLKPDEHINPFVGLGIGTIYDQRNTDMNLYTLETNVWHFALRPEAGIRVNANPGLDIILVGKYFTGFKTDDLDAQNYFTFNVGFVFKK
ncbi:MAG: outer membrane beta-barrel protein [Cyclobacteriaceae bacterium]|nr:outer membrane beta-barrel protein [Cyclobacteriaceae bacterium]